MLKSAKRGRDARRAEAPNDGRQRDVPMTADIEMAKTESVLIVDDEPAIAQVLADVAETLGLRARVASSLADALVALAEEAPDVVLADVQLGTCGATGFDLYERCRTLTQPFAGRFVFVTGHDAQRVEMETMSRFGVAVPVLSKPFTVREFSSVVLGR